MEVILRGYHDKNKKLVSADVIQIGKPVPITSVYDGERNIPVSEYFPTPSSRLPVRVATCTVTFPDGKKHRPLIIEKILESIKG